VEGRRDSKTKLKIRAFQKTYLGEAHTGGRAELPIMIDSVQNRNIQEKGGKERIRRVRGGNRKKEKLVSKGQRHRRTERTGGGYVRGARASGTQTPVPPFVSENQ